MTEQEACPRNKLYSAGLIGEVMEWFDFTVYGFFALTISTKFFPSTDQFVSLMATFAAFAIGFLMRPLGALVFGQLGDILGRKRVLTTSIFLMAFPSLIIGITPTYDTIGIFAPFLLILMRMLQGISVGGEHTGSVVYLAELSSQRNRAFSAVIPFVGTVFGVLLGSLAGVTIFTIFDHEAITRWAWRLPFLAGVMIAFVGMGIRRSLPESCHLEEKAKDHPPAGGAPKTSPTFFSDLFPQPHLRCRFLYAFYLQPTVDAKIYPYQQTVFPGNQLPGPAHLHRCHAVFECPVQ